MPSMQDAKNFGSRSASKTLSRGALILISPESFMGTGVYRVGRRDGPPRHRVSFRPASRFWGGERIMKSLAGFLSICLLAGCAEQAPIALKDMGSFHVGG